MNEVAKLSKQEFLSVVRLAPLVSVDVVVFNEVGQVLVGFRANEPARGFWFVPGGRVLKGERLEATFARVMVAELGLPLSLKQTRPLGGFQHFYDTNFAAEPGVSTHYVSLGFTLTLAGNPQFSKDQQHSELKWFGVAEALSHSAVHSYTKELIQAAALKPTA